MHDAYGKLLAVDDIVSLPCRITAVHPQEDYCNLTAVTLLPPNPPEMGPNTIVVNSRQVIKPDADQFMAQATPAKPEQDNSLTIVVGAQAPTPAASATAGVTAGTMAPPAAAPEKPEPSAEAASEPAAPKNNSINRHH